MFGLVPEMLKGADHLKNVDPFHVIRSGGVPPSTAKEAARSRWAQEPVSAHVTSASRLPADRRKELEELLARDNLLSTVASDLDLPGDVLNLVETLAASITPIFDVSDVCFEQSMAYLDYLGPFDGISEGWAFKSKRET